MVRENEITASRREREVVREPVIQEVIVIEIPVEQADAAFNFLEWSTRAFMDWRGGTYKNASLTDARGRMEVRRMTKVIGDATRLGPVKLDA